MFGSKLRLTKSMMMELGLFIVSVFLKRKKYSLGTRIFLIGTELEIRFESF
jgi:hypothetical protein